VRPDLGPIHVLLNPASGNGRALRRFRRIEPLVRHAVGPFELHLSRGPGDLTAVARSLAGGGDAPLILAAGGDGTSHEVLNGLVTAEPAGPGGSTLAWLPLGSGNDLARAVGVPIRPGRAAALIPSGRAEPIDAGWVRYRDGAGALRERAFGNSLTLGLSAAVLARVERMGKPLGGRLTYFLAAAATLVAEPAVPVTVRTGHELVHQGNLLLASFTNGPFVGAGMHIAPGAALDDGVLDLVIVRDLPRLRRLALFPRVYRGAHIGHPAVSRRTVGTATITTEGPCGMELDGELVRVWPPIEVRVLSRALRVLRPAPC
jgi:diacylglycerol kinase (ATP)